MPIPLDDPRNQEIHKLKNEVERYRKALDQSQQLNKQLLDRQEQQRKWTFQVFTLWEVGMEHIDNRVKVTIPAGDLTYDNDALAFYRALLTKVPITGRTPLVLAVANLPERRTHNGYSSNMDTSALSPTALDRLQERFDKIEKDRG